MKHDIATTMHKNGSPMADPIAFYDGHVMHARLNPFGHRFRYGVFSIAFDIDRVKTATGVPVILHQSL